LKVREVKEHTHIPWIAGVLKEFAFGGENYEGDFSITKHRDLMSFLEQTRPSL